MLRMMHAALTSILELRCSTTYQNSIARFQETVELVLKPKRLYGEGFTFIYSSAQLWLQVEGDSRLDDQRPHILPRRRTYGGR